MPMATRSPAAVILPEERAGFKFRSGHVALDLAATLAARPRPEPRELLATPADLDRWIHAAAVAPSVTEATTADLRSAQALREALYRLAAVCIPGRPFAAGDRARGAPRARRAIPTVPPRPAPGSPAR